jgi:hypothetical protein
MRNAMIVLFAALLVTTPVVLAGHDDDERYDGRYRNDRYYDDDSDDRYRDGRHQGRGRHDQRYVLIRLARDVERAARLVHRRAERRAHRVSYRESVALRRLHVLDDSATRFSRRAASRRGNPYRTQRDFFALVRAYRSATHVLDGLHLDRQVRRDLTRLRHAMNDLGRFYGVSVQTRRHAARRNAGRDVAVYGAIHF